MKNNHKSILFLITFVFILSLCMLNTEQTFLSSNSNINMKSDYQNLNLNEVEYSNATVIADNDYCRKPFSTSPDIAVDNLGGIHVVGEYSFTISGGKVYCIRYVNYTGTKVMSCKTFNLNTNSYSPNIAVDDFGGIHVVCSSSPYGIWGSDREIRYINYNRTIGWISAIVISDGYNGTYWNDGSSTNPNIAVDDLGGIHVVWEDDTDGVWGNDTEIMYTTYTEATGWLNATVISDGYDGLYWNNGFSTNPNIAVDDLGRINVVWEDETDGIWSYEGWDDLYGVWWLDDTEIMYVNYLEAKGWSNATFISDGYNVSYWNDASSASPNIAVDNLGGIHVVWSNRGSTMYVRISNPPRPSANIPFGESYLIFVIIGIIVLIVYVKRKL